MAKSKKETASSRQFPKDKYITAKDPKTGKAIRDPKTGKPVKVRVCVD